MSTGLFSKALGVSDFASPIGQDRLIRKEVQLGFIRDIAPPQNHIGLQFAPFLEVASDDVIFQYLTGASDGLAPARAQDAESELAQKDDTARREGRASIIDWSHKDHYDASDVMNYRELGRIIAELQDGNLPLTITSALEDYASRFANDTLRRRKKLDNRINWLIMTGLAAGVIAYNDGKIKFNVDFFRPAAQQYADPANDHGFADVVTNGVVDWSSNTHDPIGFIDDVKEFMFDTYGVVIDRVLTSKKVTRKIINSQLFAQRAGLGGAVMANGTLTAPNLDYLLDGWGPDSAKQVVENATGVTFLTDDSVYRTRAQGSNTFVNNRFFPEDEMLFLPSEESINEIDDTLIGFGKTLTSPHPEGNFTPSFYEWEKATTDPWGQDAGTGIKAFPVFPHMDLTFAVQVKLV